jgi:PmbA protein
MLLGSPLSAWALQQKRSYLEGRLGEKVGSDLLSVVDQPLLESGFGSRHYDGEGISAKPLNLVEKGVLKNYYIDTYYGRKLGMPPTTGSISNLDWSLGSRDQEEILQDLAEGVLVTSFLGGNSNDTTGDFSVGIRGFHVKNGKLDHPISEMNITSNHLDLWMRLVEVGCTPYPYSSYRCPALLFDDLQLSGV